MIKTIALRFLVFMTFALIAVPVSAQVGFGIKAGLNLSDLKVDDPKGTYESATGYHAGLFLRAKFSKVAIQPEVLLFTQSTDVESILGTYTDSFTYLSVPVMFKFYLISGVNIHAGPQFGFLLDGERKFDTRLFQGSSDIKDYYKSTDVSVSVGAGWDLPFFPLNLDVRYNIGVQDINNFESGEETKSRVFQVSLGWNFLN